MLQKQQISNIALVRIEQLYPFPHKNVQKILQKYPHAKEISWCQEEPQNQGGWYCIKHNIESCVSEGQTLFYSGRPTSASPAVGKLSVHLKEQQELVDQALNTGQGFIQRPKQPK